MKLNKYSIRYTAVMLGCLALLIVFSNYAGNNIYVGNNPSSKQVVVLDAGHGGMDSGAVGISGVLEKDINLSIVKKLESLLEFSGYEVILTRSDDSSIHDSNIEGVGEQKKSDMRNRLAIINTYPNAIFFSIHQNKFTQPQYFGAQMFYTDKNPDNMKLARIMQKRFKLIQPDNDREIKLSGDELYLFKTTEIPALIIECGFLSNAEDEKKLSSEEYQQKVAFTIFCGITDYINQKQMDNQNNSTEESSSSANTSATT